MKKFIKDWWPLLLIAGWWLWKRKRSHADNPNIPPRPSQERLAKDYIRQLLKNGYTKSVQPCPICGGVLYERKYIVDPYAPMGGNGTKNASDWPQLETITETACTNPNCENFDSRFILCY